MRSDILLAQLGVERGGCRVVHDVALVVRQGSWFGLIGANGSGKTSLLRAIAGRLPFATGTCLIETANLANDRAARAALIGFAPPAETLPGALRAREVLCLAGGNLERALHNVGELRQALGLDELLDRRIGRCSAGMRQRLAIALAFAAGQSMVILDEPFNWLDPVAAFDVKQVLRTMVDDGLTLITALHDLSTLARLCDGGAMMADGRIVIELDGPTLGAAQEDLLGFERQMIDALRSSLA